MAYALVAGNTLSLEADATATTIVTSAFTNNITANNLIVVGVSWAAVGTTDATVTDSAGNTYTQMTLTRDNTGGVSMATFNAVITVGGGTKPTITASFWTTTLHSVAASETYRVIIAGEFSGGATSTPLDQSGSNSQSGNHGGASNFYVAPAATVTPGTDNQLIVGFGSQVNGGSGWDVGAANNLTAGTGYTLLAKVKTVSPDGYGYSFIYKIQTTATAVQATWTNSGTGNTDDIFLSTMATLKASGAASPDTPSVTDAITTGEAATPMLKSFTNSTDALTMGDTMTPELFSFINLTE